MESMTTNCQATGFVGYAVRHNPPPYLTNLAASCPMLDVPYTTLQTDLDNDTLPSFSFITPNTVNDGHDGGDPVSIQNSDAWLAANLPQILNSAAYQRGTTAIFITWDEGEGPITPGFLGKDCSTNTTDEDCHIATIVVSPSTRAGDRVDQALQPLLAAAHDGGDAAPQASHVPRALAEGVEHAKDLPPVRRRASARSIGHEDGGQVADCRRWPSRGVHCRRRSRRRSALQRQREAERAAVVGVARRPQAAAVRFDDRAADREAHAEAVRLGAEEGREDVGGRRGKPTPVSRMATWTAPARRARW